MYSKSYVHYLKNPAVKYFIHTKCPCSNDTYMQETIVCLNREQCEIQHPKNGVVKDSSHLDCDNVLLGEEFSAF